MEQVRILFKKLLKTFAFNFLLCELKISHDSIEDIKSYFTEQISVNFDIPLK